MPFLSTVDPVVYSYHKAILYSYLLWSASTTYFGIKEELVDL
jgi:hypothetical protein